MNKWTSLGILGVIAACGQANTNSVTERAVSDLERDETVVFFDTSGWLDSEDEQWHVPIHGWVYEPQDSAVRHAAFAAILKREFELSVDDENAENFSTRLNLLIADNERGKRMVINIAGIDHTLNASEENGHFETTIQLSSADVAKHSKDGFIVFDLVTDGTDARKSRGTVRLLQPQGFVVISDIDDTVKISNVVDRKRLLEQTFLLDFAAAPGMADLYNAWSDDDVAFHFVSSSPWQLYEPLHEFLQQDGFPWASMSLKALRFRDESLLDLFKEGTETKPAAIRTILNRYPERRFVLVGDSGEQDPEVYAALLRDHPQQIGAIFVRNVTQETADNARFSAVFDDIDEHQWILFDDTAELPAKLTDIAW